jgi:RNA polymerase sigma-B factor
MNHRPAPSQPHPAGRGTPRTRQTLTAFGGLAVLLTAAFGFAPAAPGTLPPPEPPVGPPPPPIAAAPAHFPLWAIIAMVAATVVLSVATTLITLALAHLRQAHRTPAATPETLASAPAPFTMAEPEAGQAEILTSHPQSAGYDMYRADRG